MITMVRTLGRVLWMHWPALLAWYLGGMIVRNLIIQLAGWVGVYSSLGMFALMPIAALARLVPYVAMFLVVRDSLRELTALAPQPTTTGAERRTFVEALLAGVLPFFAVYEAWGFIREDVYGALTIAQGLSSDLKLAAGLQAALDGTEAPDLGLEESVGELTVTPLVIVVLLLAFGGRWAWKRWNSRLPKWSSVFAVYLEALWIYLFVTVIKDLIRLVTSWIDGRVGMQWLTSIGDWFAATVPVVTWAWEGTLWVVGALGDVLVLPLAWLAIAGTLYGQAVRVEQPSSPRRFSRRFTTRMQRVPGPVRRRLADLWNDFADRFRGIWNAIVLMWRAGPITIALYVLAFNLWVVAERLLTIALPHLFGAHPSYWWDMMFAPIALLVPLLLEPLRIAIVAAGYDTSLGSVRRSAVGDPNDLGAGFTGDEDVNGERTLGSVSDEK